MLFSSCSKDGPEKATPQTTYTVVYNISDISTSSISVTTDVTLFEYNEAGEKIGNNSMKSVHTGTTKTFTASKNAVKVKVYIDVEMSNGTSTSSMKKWVQQVYYLEEGADIKIQLEDSTMIGNYEP